MTVSVRVRKHRETFARHNVRLEVWLAGRTPIAKEQGQAVWKLVQDALTAHLARHPALSLAPHSSSKKRKTAQGN